MREDLDEAVAVDGEGGRRDREVVAVEVRGEGAGGEVGEDEGAVGFEGDEARVVAVEDEFVGSAVV